MRWPQTIRTSPPGLHRSQTACIVCVVMSTPAPPTRRQHVQALVLAFACSELFQRDALLPRRALVPHPPELFDVVMAEAIADGRFDPADAFRGNVGMADKYLQSLCWDRVLQDRLRRGELPSWPGMMRLRRARPTD
jgi:hypothetical protein